MKIINKDINNGLAEISHYPVGGVISGAIRIALAVAQIALNALLFLPALALSLCRSKKGSDSGWDSDSDSKSKSPIDKVLNDISHSFGHTTRGIAEIAVPGSWLFLGINDHGLIPGDRLSTSLTDRAWSPIEDDDDD